ncbi:MAG: SirB2 family protein [Alphaproteobacteria bacterium]|nr:SirB2 family protein [Alphaproteobacteria bacterium]
MNEYYHYIRIVHIGAVFISGGFFLLRAIGLHAFGARWPMQAWARYASYTVDTVLLAAALLLMTITRQYPFVDGWLTMKVTLLVIYIILGSYGLKYGKTRRIRIGCTIGAVMLYGYIISVARAHHVLGVFAG